MQTAAAVKVESAASGPRLVKLPTMLSVRTVAKRLKKRRKWVYGMCFAGVWGATRLGERSWRIPEDRLLAWMVEHV